MDGGRCPVCTGDGFERVEMQFLSDVFVPCEACDGARFRKEVLDIRYRGKSIRDVLEMTVEEALPFFEKRKKVTGPLETLARVGLAYLRLGQPLNTLSGGEAQRLKLAAEMSRNDPENVLFLFDEPTTGLHFEDIRVLLRAFNELIERGASILLIEHNLDVIKNADWILDLGPEGGDAGGEVVAAGPPDKIAASPASHTGRYLAPYLREEPPRLETAPLARSSSGPRQIQVRGARQHNLKKVDVDIPRDQLVVLTGLSGSGKSSLAFDIVFAEGQRRFLESLSAFARQYIQVLDRPEVDLVAGMPPTIAIEQRLTRGGRKSTVATVTEVYHYLRLLYAKLGVPHCVDCDLPITPQSEDQIFEDLVRRFAGERVSLFAPLVRARKGAHREVIERARKDGFRKLRIDGKIVASMAAGSLRSATSSTTSRRSWASSTCEPGRAPRLERRSGAPSVSARARPSPSREERAATTTSRMRARGASVATKSQIRACSPSTAATVPASSARGSARSKPSTRLSRSRTPTSASPTARWRSSRAPPAVFPGS